MRSIATISVVVLLLCRVVLAQDSASPIIGVAKRPNISEVTDLLDKNGLAQARVGIRTIPQSADENLQRDEYPALILFYSEGFRLVQGDTCSLILRNDSTRLISHSKLAYDPAPGEQLTAELFIPLSRLSIKKGRKPFRHTANPDKARLLGTWRTEFKGNRSQEDVVLTLFRPGETTKLRVWKADTLTFTFGSKETSEKFDAAFRQAIEICQPIRFLKRSN